MNTKINNNSTNTLGTNLNISISNKKEFNSYNPENFYKDFDFSENEMDIDEIVKLDQNEKHNHNSIKSSDDQITKNQFRYQSFSDRIKKIKVKFNSNFENDMSFLQIQTKQGFKIDTTDSESNFLAILNREKILNTSDEFKKFESELQFYTQSYLIYINNSEKILRIFSEKLKIYIEEEIKNIPFITSILEILSGLIKDLRDECYDEFLDNIFPNLIKFLSETQNIDAIEKTFNVLVNIFKFLQNAILKPRNFSKFFYILSELIFSKTKYIRKFTCESISYLIKNLDEEKLSEIMIIILNPFVCPEKYFDIELKEISITPMKIDTEENKSEEKSFNEIYLEQIIKFDSYLDFLSLKQKNLNIKDSKNPENNYFINFLHEALLNFEFDMNNLLGGFDNNSLTSDNIENLNKKLKLKIFLIECLSDFIFEILIGVNNDLSIKADIFLEKIKIKIPSNSFDYNTNNIKNNRKNIINKENFEYLNFILDISVVTSLIKLYSKLKNEKKNSIITLLNYYFFKKLKKDILFSKLKNEKISNQLTFYNKSYDIHKDNKMEFEENINIRKRKLTKLKFTNANCFNLMNFFIFELFNKHKNIFDKEIIKFFFEFLKFSMKKIFFQDDLYKTSLFNTFYENKFEIPNKDYFSKNLKIDLLGLLLKFYPEDFSQIFKLDFMPVNPYNKIYKTFNLSLNKDLEDLSNLMKIFYNYENTNIEQDEFFDLNCTTNLIDENILYLFLEKLKKLQNFRYFKFLSLFEFRHIIISDFPKSNHESTENIKKNQNNINKGGQQLINVNNEANTKFKIDMIKNQNPYFDNDDYNFEYEPDLINKLFSCIMNIFDYHNVENILDIKTTYDLILIKNTKNDDDIQYNFSPIFNNNDENKINLETEDNITSNYKHTNLVIMNENNLKTIVNYLVNFSILENKSEIQENVLNIQKYIQIYSFLITGDLLIKSLSSLESVKQIKSFEKEGIKEYINIKTNQNVIYYNYIKKSIELILLIFENQGLLKKENKSLSSKDTKANFASEILKLTKEDEIMLFNILFRDFNNISTFYIEKSTAFINLLNIFTVNYLKIIFILNKEKSESFSQNLQKENESFLSRILYILFTNCDDGSAFKTINIIIRFYFNNNFTRFYEFCKNKNIFFMKKLSISNPIYEVLKSPSNNYHEENHDNIQIIKSLDEFLYTFSIILYSSENKIKREFLIFCQLWLKSENNLNIQLLDDITDLIKHILTLEFDPLNDKKYSLNYEILVSKIELITLGSEDYNALFLFSFFYDFLLGSYWIRLVKTFWPVLTKCIERFFVTLGKLFNERLLWIIFEKSIKIFDFIYKVGTIDDLLEKVDKKIFKKFYFIFLENHDDNFSNENNLNNKIITHSYLENIIASSFYAKRDNVSSLALNVNLFYEGFSKSQHNLEIILNSSNNILIEKNQDVKNKFYLFEKFYNCFSTIINARNENWINELLNTKESSISGSLNENYLDHLYHEKDTFESSDKFYKNYFNNFIIQKESGKFFGITYKMLQEAILTIISKLNLSLIYKLKENKFSQTKDEIKIILNDQLIFSRTVTNQKLCIQIYINLEPKLKKFSLLFEKIIENTNLIDRLYNLKDIKTDSNESITPNERELLIPILIRLYYSKYFYLTHKNKKVKTRNKINIVSFFIQLTPVEFQEYIKVIFRPLLIFEMLNHEFRSTMNQNESEKINVNIISDKNTGKNAVTNKFDNEILFCENPFIANNFINSNINDIDQRNCCEINKFEGIKYLDLRIYRKIIEIISLNFKQINSLFESSIDFLTIFIMNILIFIKKLNTFYKSFFNYKKYIQNIFDSGKHNHIEEEIIFDFQFENKNGIELNSTTVKSYQEELDNFLLSFENHIKKDMKISHSKFINYWEKNKILEYSNLYFKFVKEIKKKSFDLLKRIFSKFSFKKELIKIVTDKLLIEYQDTFNYLPQTQNLKANSLIQFTFNIAKNPIMHRIFIDNSYIFVSLCKILSNKTIDNSFLNTLLEFLEDLIIPYSEYKCELEELQLKSQISNEYSELRNFSKIDKNNRVTKLCLPDEEEKERSKRRKMTSESQLSFLQSERDKSEEEDFTNANNLRNILEERIELNKIDQIFFFENESKLIKENFKLLNDNLIILLTNGRLKLKIKEYITERTIYLLLELWNIFDINDIYFQKYLNENQESINKILQILIGFISKDHTIFKDEYKMYLSNILRLCNILISICINKSKFYIDFLHLIYKISDSQSRLIVSVILKQINEPINQEIITKFNTKIIIGFKTINYPLKNLNNNFEEVYSMIMKLNILREGKTLDSTDDLDIDLLLDNLNLITEEYCKKYLIVHLEPLIYQLISLANFSEDFSIQTLAISKIKIILEKIIYLFDIYTKNYLNEQNIDNHTNLIIKLELEVLSNIIKVFLNLLNLLNFNIHINKNSANNFGVGNFIMINKLKQEKIKKNIMDLFSFINNTLHKSSENILLNRKCKQENITLLAMDIYSISSLNLNIFDFNSEIYFKENYFDGYLNVFSHLICEDLYMITSEKGDFDFFEGIMNLKFNIRLSVLNKLKIFLNDKKITYFSLINIIIPLVKSFLNLEANESKNTQINNKKESFDVFHKKSDLNSIIDSSIELLVPISKMLQKDDFLALLMHFYRKISKANNQEASKNYEDKKFIFEKLYEILNQLLECLNLFKFEFSTEYDFDKEFNNIMRILIADYKNKASMDVFLNPNFKEIKSLSKTENNSNNKNEENNNLLKLDDSKINQFTNNKSYSKDLFTDSFNKIAVIFEEKLKERKKDVNDNNISKQLSVSKKDGIFKEKYIKLNSFSQDLITNLFKMLKNMLIDHYRKEKTKKYYIRNFVIKPFFNVLKKMDPKTLKYEMLSLVYEIINNLKNKDLDVREKARRAIRILIETLGPFISNVLIEQLKSQLTNGYQRYILGYTCNFILGILNKLYLNFKEIEEFGESLALKNMIYLNQKFLEIDQHLEDDNENKVIKLNENQLIDLNVKGEVKKGEIEHTIIKELNDGYYSNTNEFNTKNANFDFQFLSKFKQFNKKDIELIFDFSVGIVVPTLLEEIFGEIAEEKEIEEIVKKCKEAKEVKAYNSFLMIASRVDFKTAILNLIFPIRNFVLEKETNNQIINKINEIMNFIIKGLKENITLRIEDIILISYSLINIGLEINIKNSKEIRQAKNLTIKGGDICESKKAKNNYQSQKNELVSLQSGTNSKSKFAIEIARKFLLEKNEIIISKLFTQFGLDIFLLSIKKKVFDFNCLKSKLKESHKNIKENSNSLKENEFKQKKMNLKNYESESSDEFQNELFYDFKNDFAVNISNNNQKHKSYYEKIKVDFSEEEFKDIINKIEVLLYSVVCCLKINSNNILSKSLKILTKLFDSRLFMIKKNLKKIGSNLFKNLGVINLSESDKPIAQTILSCISEILKKFKFFEINESQMKILINFLKIHINKLEIKSYIFACLLAILKRKFLHPCIYDMIDYIQETFLISFDEATKSLCENIFIEFFNNYPLEDTRKQKYINFFIINLESNTRNCTLNSLRMLRKLIEFSNADLKVEENNKKSNKNNKEIEISNSLNQVSNILKDFIDFIILKLLYLIANTSDFEIKNLCSEIIKEIFEHMINKEKYELYLVKVFEWIKIEEKIKSIFFHSINLIIEFYKSKFELKFYFKYLEKTCAISEENSEEDSEIINGNIDHIYLDEKEKNYVKLGLNFLSILTSKENSSISNKINQIFEILIKNIKFEFNRFEYELDKQIENRNYITLSKNAYSNEDYSTKIFEANTNLNKFAKTESLELKEEDLTILNIQIENWDIFYLHIINLEKLLEIYPSIFCNKLNQDVKFCRILFRSIKHPHIFIKTSILRIISKLFSEDSNILNMNDFDQVNRFIKNLVIDKNSSCIGDEKYQSNTIQTIFDNLKFIILNKDIDLKENIINSAVDVSSFLVYLLLKLYMKNKNNQNDFEDFSFYAYEFICKLYAQSKNYMAKKEYTNKIIRRILIIIENIISYTNLKYNMFDLLSNKNFINYNKIKNESDKFQKKIQQENEEKSKLIEIILEPLLSLLFRLTTNNLIDEEIKIISEKIIGSLRDLIKEEIFSKKYNDITKRITLLRRKRKVEQKEKILRK